MKNTLKRIEILFPCHNRRDLTIQCLKSLAKIDKTNLVVHIVIVDDGSTDRTSESIEKEFPEVELIKADGSLWFTEGTNVGVRAALKHNPDYVLMMNDDQIFDAEFLKAMVETAEKYPRSVIGSLLLLWDTPHKLFQVSPRWETLSGGWRHWYQQTVWTIPKKAWEVEAIVGNCVLVPVEAIRECGLMNSKRYPNFGDAEYTPRLRKRGWRLLIEPRARVFCQPNNIPAQFKKMSLRQKLDALIFNLGHTQNLRRRFYGYWDAAPNKLQGALGFGVFFARVVFKINAESAAWGEKHREKPISETFAHRVLE